MQLLLFLGMAFGLFMIATIIGMGILSKMTGIGINVLQNTADWDLNNPAMLTFVRGMILLQFLFLFTSSYYRFYQTNHIFILTVNVFPYQVN